MDPLALRERLAAGAAELGFDAVGVAGVDLAEAEPGLLAWLDAGFHGTMDYMARHGLRRARPAELVPGTVSVITARMNYLAQPPGEAVAKLDDGATAYVSRYALGRDYHKVLRGRLQALADRIAGAVGPFGYRVFTDSAPVLEVELAQRAGLGWRGKHTLALHREAGSYFFLGEIFTDLPLPPSAPVTAHCGSCSRCIEVCPTRAIVAPYRLDARRCISYLTIEHEGSIPEPLRPAIGNRVYGCDDCQLFCPWNKYARVSPLPDFAVRHGLDVAPMTALFRWTREEFERTTEGSAIRRIGYERWSRNLAVGLGNARTTPEVVATLAARRDDASALVREHVAWALGRHEGRGKSEEAISRAGA